MKVLLDTCALLWLAENPRLLSGPAQALLVDADAKLYISSFAAYEIALKQAKGKLELPAPAASWFPQVLQRLQIEEIPVESKIALTAVSLPLGHGDPGDRIVLATAEVHQMTIVTADRSIRDFVGATVVW